MKANNLPAVRSAKVENEDIELVLGRPITECDQNHAAVVAGILDKLAESGLVVDALGNLRDQSTWGRVVQSMPDLAADLAFNLRRDGIRVDTGRVQETAEVMARRAAQRRRFELTCRFIGMPAEPAGMLALRRWVRAVTSEEREVDVQAMAHWLHLVKSRVAGRPGERHLMPVIVSPRQGIGKSVAVAKLCAPWQELFDPDISLENIIDERNAPHLAKVAIGCWDELGGLGRADMERVKHRLTSPVVAYRPMRTTERVELPALMSFIGTSNRALGELVRDTTGMRRFYEIHAGEFIDWNTINSINYELVWRAVSEADLAPGVVHRAIIEAAQEPQRYRDAVQLWIEDEDTDGWPSRRPLDPNADLLPALTPEQGASNADLHQRFLRWANEASERALSREAISRRLRELGWIPFRLPRAQGQPKGHRRIPS